MQKYAEPNLIVQLSFTFALKIIQYTATLENRRKYVIARQFLKSGTSIGANVREAQNAESKLDFIHKLKIASKEAGETEYWLLLCNESDGYNECNELIRECNVIIKLLSKIIASTKRNKQLNN